MQIYISKDNQQSGPFEEAKVLEMLKNNELSPNDLAIRHGENEWQKLSVYFPNVGNVVPLDVVTAPSTPKKSRKSLLLGCGGFLVITLLIACVLGILAYRNMFPADSTENLPESVSELKLDKRNPPEGNIWGTQTDFRGIYYNSTKSLFVIYLMTVYKDEATAKNKMLSESDDCSGNKLMSNTLKSFSFVKDGTEISQGVKCGVAYYIQKDNKLVIIDSPSTPAETMVKFAENLPFNQGSKMTMKTDK